MSENVGIVFKRVNCIVHARIGCEPEFNDQLWMQHS